MGIGGWPNGRSAVIAGTAALSLLAVAGTAVPIPLFYGVDFVFGSVAVMLAVPLFGALHALAVALAGGLCTLPLWEHPYALVIFVAEGGFVATLYRRGWRNLVLADLTYWLLLGAPLVLAFYGGALGMPWQAASLIALKQPLNGVFNALLAGLVLIGAGLIRRAPERRYMRTTELSAILFHVMVGLIFLAGAVPIIQHGHSARAHEEDALFWRLHDRAEETAAHLTARPTAGPGYWASLLAAERTHPDFGLGLLNADGRLVAREGELQELAANPVRQETTVAGLGHWAPAHISNPMQRWKGGRYRVTVELAGHPRLARVVSE